MNDIERRINEKINDNEFQTKMPFPKKNFLLEVTNNCNNSCVFCANRLMTRSKGFIDENLAYRLIKEAYMLGEREIGFYATGEPLLNRKLEKYIAFAKKTGYKYIYITTNGLLANLDRVKKLYKAGLDSIKFSINAVQEDIYYLIHGVKSFKTVITNLKEIKSWKDNNKLNLKVFVSYIATNESFNSKKEIKNFFGDLCDSIAILPVINQGGLLPKNDELTVQELSSIHSVHMPCVYPFNSLIVTYEGYLTACCMDFQNYLVYADLNKKTLKESWNNEVIVKLRKRHLDKELSSTLCENCLFNKKKKPKPLLKEYASDFDYSVFKNDLELTKRKREKDM